MLYPFIPSLRGGTRDSGREGPEWLFPQDTAIHMCTGMLAKAQGAGLGKPNLANQAGQRAEPEREQKAGILRLWVWDKRKVIRAEGGVEAQGKGPTDRHCSGLRVRSPCPAQPPPDSLPTSKVGPSCSWGPAESWEPSCRY